MGESTRKSWPQNQSTPRNTTPAHVSNKSHSYANMRWLSSSSLACTPLIAASSRTSFHSQPKIKNKNKTLWRTIISFEVKLLMNEWKWALVDAETKWPLYNSWDTILVQLPFPNQTFPENPGLFSRNFLPGKGSSGWEALAAQEGMRARDSGSAVQLRTLIKKAMASFYFIMLLGFIYFVWFN